MKTQKSNTGSLYVMESKESSRADAELHRIAKKTIDEGLWDSVWLQKKYPDRFKGYYEREELGIEQYDPALYPEEYQNDDSNR